MDAAERVRNALDHAVRIAAMLEHSVIADVAERIWRARVWVDNKYVVCTLVQHIKAAPAIPGHLSPAITVYAVGDYVSASVNFAGPYSVDEIVAFLALDKLDPAQVEWNDETKYSTLAVVSDIVKVLH